MKNLIIAIMIALFSAIGIGAAEAANVGTSMGLQSVLENPFSYNVQSIP